MQKSDASPMMIALTWLNDIHYQRAQLLEQLIHMMYSLLQRHQILQV